jgi:hypothetical protein
MGLIAVKPNPYFVTGLREAEGYFSVTKSADKRAKFGHNYFLRFKITMLENDTELLKLIHSFLSPPIFALPIFMKQNP